MANIVGVESPRGSQQTGSLGGILPEGVFPDFEITETLVRCGSVVMVRARYVPDASNWIVLVLEPSMFKNDAHRDSFVAQMHELAEVEHNSLLGVAGADVSHGWVSVVYEDFTGEPLLGHLKGKMSPPRAVKIIGSAAEAVHAVHEAGFVHRDIHPGWILIDEAEDGELTVKLACAGVVPALYDSDDAFLQSITDRPIELRAYFAPEQLVPSDPSDFRADIYTLSALTYRLLVGNPPGGFTVLPSSRADVNRGTDDIVLKAMHTDRTKRYASAAAFAEHVKQVGSGNNNDPLAGLRYMKQPDAKDQQVGSGPKRLIPALVLFGLIAVTIGAGVMLFKFLGESESSVASAEGNGSAEALPAAQSKELKEVRELMDKGDKEAALAVAASLIRSSVRAGEAVMDPAAMEAAVLMAVEAGDTEGALDLSQMRSPQSSNKDDVVDWRRVEALTKQLEVGKTRHEQAMKRADAARQAGNFSQERVELATASGFLPEHPDAKDRVNFGRQDYDPWKDLEKRMEHAEMADGSTPEFSIHEHDAELHVDLSNNPQLTNVAMLEGMPVTHLNLSNTAVTDLGPLRGMPLQSLNLDRTRVKDLSPLEGAPLRLLSAEGISPTGVDHVLKGPMIESAVVGNGSTMRKQILPPKPGRGWINGMGMRFDPVLVGGTVLIGQWETRRGDFALFAEATAVQIEPGMTTLLRDGNWGEFANCSWESPPFDQDENHPVVGISHIDASAFCKWLTFRDRESGQIGPQAFYRLPSSSEWSLAAGILTGHARKAYPWGMEWPATRLTGNFPTEMRRMVRAQLVDYHDGYLATSPVASFRGSRFADIGGNVREWCQDELALEGNAAHVIRGAAWGMEVPESDSFKSVMRLDREELLAANSKWSNLGFRVVLDLGLGY